MLEIMKITIDWTVPYVLPHGYNTLVLFHTRELNALPQ